MKNNRNIDEKIVYYGYNYNYYYIDVIKFINIDKIIDKYEEDAPKDSDYLYD
jgi:hypothetical protein